MTHRQCPQQFLKNWFKGLVLNDLCFPLENEYAKGAPGWREQISWDAEGKWWVTSRQMLFGKVMFCNSIMQSLSNGFPTHCFFLHELLLLLVADFGRLAIIHECLPKLGQPLSSYSHSAGHKTIYTVLEAKWIPHELPPSKTKGITACDQNRDRDTPSCNQEQQALMKPHAVAAFRLQIKLNHSAAEAEIRGNLWLLSGDIRLANPEEHVYLQNL